MKKLFFLFLAVLCTLLLVGCGVAEEESNPPEAEKPYTDTFSLTESDFSAVRAVEIRSGMTGKTVLLTDSEDIAAIVSAALPIVGQNPVSSRGTYGWTYSFRFYETDAPGENDVPVPVFSLHIFDDKAYITNGVYEKIDRFTYPAMYTVNLAAAESLAAACDRFHP